MWKVLLVEDEIFVRESVKELIHWEEFGFVVSGEAGNGQEALEQIKADPPDLVLTDIIMPIMDGIELLKETRKLGHNCKFVMLTCMGEFEYVRQAMEYGASNYILKLSMSVNDLRETLQKIGRELGSAAGRPAPAAGGSQPAPAADSQQSGGRQTGGTQSGGQQTGGTQNAGPQTGSQQVDSPPPVAPRAGKKPHTVHPEINKILDYMEQNYAGDITVKSMSQYVMMGENYVSALFKKKTGSTLIHYLHELRVGKATELLAQTELPVNEVGANVGFVNDNYFIKIFKRLTGQTPSQYRQSIRTGNRTGDRT